MSDMTNSWLQSLFRRSRFSLMADTAILMTATLASQVVSFFTLPLLARYYGPTQYGFYAPIIAAAMVIGVIACGRYELAILLPKDVEEANAVVFLSFIISFSISLLAFIFFAVLQLSNLFFNSLYWFVAFLIPISAIGTILNYWLIRRKDYKTIALARITESVITIGFQLAFAFWLKPIAYYLLLGNLIGTCLAISIKMARFFQAKNGISVAIIPVALQMARKYRRFPTVESWGAFANKLGTQFPIFILQLFSSSDVVGIYSMVIRLLSIPITLLGSSFNSVFNEKIASFNRAGLPIWSTVKTNISLFSATTFVPYCLLLVGANYFVPRFLGPEWVASIKIIQVLSLGYWANLVYSPLSLIFIVREKQKNALISHMLVFLIPNVLLGLLLIISKSDIFTVFLYLGVCKVLLYSSLSIWSLTEGARHPFRLIGDTING